MSSTTQKEGNVLVRYLRGAIQELKKVTWPSRQETWRKSWIVIWFSIGFALFLGGVDYLLNQVIEFIV